jgi:cell division protein ZapA (FtsZ GTPase activity inhibitor)
MGNDNGQHQAGDVGERIASFIKAEVYAERRPACEDDARTMRAAAGRLDQLLGEIKDQARDKQVTDEDRKVLRAAAGKLDQLLGEGGDKRITHSKARSRSQDTE